MEVHNHSQGLRDHSCHSYHSHSQDIRARHPLQLRHFSCPPSYGQTQPLVPVGTCVRRSSRCEHGSRGKEGHNHIQGLIDHSRHSCHSRHSHIQDILAQLQHQHQSQHQHFS